MKRGDARTLWWAVGLAFSALALAWVALFFLVGKHPVKPVPLVTSKAGKEARP